MQTAFFHPDFTVGIGIAPIQHTLADFTAGRESHPALKTPYFIALKIPQRRLLVKAEQMCYTIFIPVPARLFPGFGQEAP